MFEKLVFVSRMKPAKTRKRKTRRHKNRKQRAGAKLVLGLLGIFKNESMVIREWVDHYRKQGYDHIVLLDNGSTDDYKSKLIGTESFVHVLSAPEPHKQNEHYNKIGLPKLKELGVNVLSILDLDEYLFVKDGRTIREFVETFFADRLNGKSGPSGFQVAWSMFGSSGHEKQPESVRKSFTWRQKELSPGSRKTTIWLEDMESDGLNLHRSKVNGKIIENPPELQLNHYAIMSKEYFNKVKKTRGDADNPKTNTIRDDTYFKGYDHKNVQDFTLKGLVEKGKA